MSRRWIRCFMIHFTKYVVLLFGGAIIGGFIGYSIVNIVSDHGIAALAVLILGIVMLVLGAWIASLATSEEIGKDEHQKKMAERQRGKDNVSA